MELAGKRVAILAEDMYEDPELWYPYYRLLEARAAVTIAGTGSSNAYKSKHGYPVRVDAQVADLRALDFDGVIVPGGFAPDLLRRYPWVLVSAGILRGRRATSLPAIRDDVANAGADWQDAEVVRDGNLITSRRPADLPAFMRSVIAALSGA